MDSKISQITKAQSSLKQMLADQISALPTEQKDICIGMQPVRDRNHKIDGFRVIYSNENEGAFCKFKGSRVPRLGFLSGEEVISILRDKAKQSRHDAAQLGGGVPAPLTEIVSAPETAMIQEIREIPGKIHEYTEVTPLRKQK